MHLGEGLIDMHFFLTVLAHIVPSCALGLCLGQFSVKHLSVVSAVDFYVLTVFCAHLFDFVCFESTFSVCRLGLRDRFRRDGFPEILDVK